MTVAELHYKKMTETPLTKLIISLGIPTTISMLVTSIYNMADTYFVGTLGETPQAAVGVLFSLQAIIQAIAFMFGQGSGTLVSKALANKNNKEADEYASSAIFIACFMGAIIMLLGFIFFVPMLKLLGSTDTILPYAKEYGLCVLLGAPVVMVSFVFNNILRYEGKAFFAMFGLVSGGIINILGDYLFVMVFKMGVLGSGIATLFSQIISCSLLFYFHSKKAQSNLSLFSISRKASTYFTISKIGFPALIRQGLTALTTGILNNTTKQFGDAAIAAMSVVSRINMFVICVDLGIGQGFQPVASFNYSARLFKRVKHGLLVTMALGVAFVSAIALFGIYFSDNIVYLIQKQPQVIEIASPALKYSLISSIFMAFFIPTNMLHQSIRKAGISSFLSMISGVVFIPLLLFTTSHYGILGIQISRPVADILAMLISIPFTLNFLLKPDDKMK